MPKKFHSGKNIKITLPAKIATEVEKLVEDEGYESISDFGRYVIQDYLLRKQYGLVKAPGGI